MKKLLLALGLAAALFAAVPTVATAAPTTCSGTEDTCGASNETDLLCDPGDRGVFKVKVDTLGSNPSHVTFIPTVGVVLSYADGSESVHVIDHSAKNGELGKANWQYEGWEQFARVVMVGHNHVVSSTVIVSGVSSSGFSDYKLKIFPVPNSCGTPA